MWIVAAVKRCHQGTFDVAVTQAERMPEFMSSDLKKIGTAIAFDGPSFAIVEVSVTTIYRKIRVCQGAARSIERITVAVLAYLESDFDVNLNESPLLGKNIILVIGRISIINKYIMYCIWDLTFSGPVLRVNVKSVSLDQTPNAFAISLSTSCLFRPVGYLLILYVRFFVRHLDPTVKHFIRKTHVEKHERIFALFKNMRFILARVRTQKRPFFFHGY